MMVVMYGTSPELVCTGKHT